MEGSEVVKRGFVKLEGATQNAAKKNTLYTKCTLKRAFNHN